MWLKEKMHYDDALDAFGVHAVGGFVGAILTGVFAVSAIGGEGRSALFDGNAGQVWIQFEGTIAPIVCAAAVTFVIHKVPDLPPGLRLTSKADLDVPDLHPHAELPP